MALIKLNNNSISAVTALPAGVGGSLIKLNETTISASVANVEFDSTVVSSDYSIFKFVGYAVPASDNQDFKIRFSNGGTFAGGATDYACESTHIGGSTDINFTTTNSIEITHSGVGSAAGEQIEFDFNVINLHNANTRTTAMGFNSYLNSGGNQTGNNFAGHRRSIQADDGVRLFFSTGNIESGFIQIFGVKQ